MPKLSWPKPTVHPVGTTPDVNITISVVKDVETPKLSARKPAFDVHQEEFVPLSLARDKISEMEEDMRIMKEEHMKTVEELESTILSWEKENEEHVKDVLTKMKKKAEDQHRADLDLLNEKHNEMNELRKSSEEIIHSLKTEAEDLIRKLTDTTTQLENEQRALEVQKATAIALSASLEKERNERDEVIAKVSQEYDLKISQIVEQGQAEVAKSEEKLSQLQQQLSQTSEQHAQDQLEKTKEIESLKTELETSKSESAQKLQELERMIESSKLECEGLTKRVEELLLEVENEKGKRELERKEVEEERKTDVEKHAEEVRKMQEVGDKRYSIQKRLFFGLRKSLNLECENVRKQLSAKEATIRKMEDEILGLLEEKAQQSSTLLVDASTSTIPVPRPVLQTTSPAFVEIDPEETVASSHAAPLRSTLPSASEENQDSDLLAKKIQENDTKISELTGKLHILERDKKDLQSRLEEVNSHLQEAERRASEIEREADRRRRLYEEETSDLRNMIDELQKPLSLDSDDPESEKLALRKELTDARLERSEMERKSKMISFESEETKSKLTQKLRLLTQSNAVLKIQHSLALKRAAILYEPKSLKEGSPRPSSPSVGLKKDEFDSHSSTQRTKDLENELSKYQKAEKQRKEEVERCQEKIQDFERELALARKSAQDKNLIQSEHEHKIQTLVQAIAELQRQLAERTAEQSAVNDQVEQRKRELEDQIKRLESERTKEESKTENARKSLKEAEAAKSTTSSTTTTTTRGRLGAPTGGAAARTRSPKPGSSATSGTASTTTTDGSATTKLKQEVTESETRAKAIASETETLRAELQKLQQQQSSEPSTSASTTLPDLSALLSDSSNSGPLISRVRSLEDENEELKSQVAQLQAQLSEVPSPSASLDYTNPLASRTLLPPTIPSSSSLEEAEEDQGDEKAEQSGVGVGVEAELVGDNSETPAAKSKTPPTVGKRPMTAAKSAAKSGGKTSAAQSAADSTAAASAKAIKEMETKLTAAESEILKWKTKAEEFRAYKDQVDQMTKKMKANELEMAKAKKGAAASSDSALKEAEKRVSEVESQYKRQISELQSASTKELKSIQEKAEKTEKELTKTKSVLEKCQVDLASAQESLSKATKTGDSASKEIERLTALAQEGDVAKQKVTELNGQLKEALSDKANLETAYKQEVTQRKKLYNMIEDMKGKIRVYARCRPMGRSELERGDKQVVTFPDEFTIKVLPKDKDFIYDHAFGPESTQEEVFEDTKHLVQSAVDGYAVCIFAYGQTGSGKTFTIAGDERNPGVVPRAMSELFSIMERDSKDFEFHVRCYMLELYNDQLFDLFADKKTQATQRLDIKKDAKGVVFVSDAVIKEAGSMEELRAIYDKGQSGRHVRTTAMNSSSSRSHLIFSILVESRSNHTGALATGKLSLVDLAGSERLAKTQITSPEGLKEAQSINLSLAALGNVISALSTGGTHIPYRDNKLTLLMSDSLGGNAKTLMFVNVSPADYNVDETLTSLSYASRVKLITNNATKQEETKEVQRLKGIIEQLKKGMAVDDSETLVQAASSEEMEYDADGVPVPK